MRISDWSSDVCSSDLLAILVGFLAVPIWSYAGRPADDTRNIYTVVGDKSWSSGPLSQAHHALEGRCETCHQKALDRKSTRRTPVTNAHLVCRLLLEKKKILRNQ